MVSVLVSAAFSAWHSLLEGGTDAASTHTCFEVVSEKMWLYDCFLVPIKSNIPAAVISVCFLEVYFPFCVNFVLRRVSKS